MPSWRLIEWPPSEAMKLAFWVSSDPERALTAMLAASRAPDEAEVERVARVICEAGQRVNFSCVCPHKVDGWCLDGAMLKKARAAWADMLARTGGGKDEI